MVPWAQYNSSVVDTPAHRQLAAEAAEQSLVLLKNDNNALPWKAKSGMKVAVIGRNANATENMQGNYFGTPPYLVTPLQGISKFATTTYADGTDIDKAVAVATAADAVVLVVGLTSEGQRPGDETEGHDRQSLLLPLNQNALIAAVSKAAASAKKPVAVVTMNGGPVDLTDVKANADTPSLIWCGYPGQSGGDAIAKAIFGETNTFGKLTVTWYPASFSDQVKITDMGMRPNKKTGNPGRTYRFYTGTPVFKFGFGLSYTTIATWLSAPASVSLSAVNAELTKTRAKTSTVAQLSVAVKNTGSSAGDEVVMVFVAPPNAGLDGAPLQSLVAYDRVKLAVGEEVALKFDVASHHFTYANVEGLRTAPAGAWKVWVGTGNEVDATEIVLV